MKLFWTMPSSSRGRYSTSLSSESMVSGSGCRPFRLQSKQAHRQMHAKRGTHRSFKTEASGGKSTGAPLHVSVDVTAAVQVQVCDASDIHAANPRAPDTQRHSSAAS
jgi:hypothetical protein